MIYRGEIFLVDLGREIKGSEQSGVRPCIILQNNKGNRHSTTTIVALLTSKKKSTKYGGEYPMQVPLTKNIVSEGQLKSDSLILCEQLYTIDQNSRLLKRLGRVTNPIILKKIDNALKVSLGMDQAS